MKILGIDYGTKRIGIAISDDSEKFAFPKEIILNDNNLIAHIVVVCKDEKIKTIVIGESLDYKGRENIVMKEIKKFIKSIKKEINITIIFEPEFMTTVQVKRLQKYGIKESMRPRKTPERGVCGKVDASAAAIILQTYLDKKQQTQ